MSDAWGTGSGSTWRPETERFDQDWVFIWGLTMRKFPLATVVFGSLLAILVEASPAQAQASRTWVSGVGDDVNPCSRTAPCKTFAGAISKTATNGIINCIDPGGFGAVTITKSITIDCEGTFGGILAAGTNGVNVNGAGIVVTLRNLSIEGFVSGLIGVNFINGSALHIEKCFIHGFNAGTAAGIRMATTVVAELFVSETELAENGSGTATGGGIVVAPTGSGAARVTLDRVRSRNNTVGLLADGLGASIASAGVRVAVRNSTFSGNSSFGVRAVSTGASARVSIVNNQIAVTDNGGGIVADGANSLILVTGSMVAHNVGVGLSVANGGVITSQQNNQVGVNLGGNGTFTNTFPLQ